MTIVLFLTLTTLFVLGGGFGIYRVYDNKKTFKTYVTKSKELAGMSWASREIIKEYYELPESNRPYANIRSMVTALDTKYGVEEVNEHFREKFYEYRTSTRRYMPSWTCNCYKCDFDEYKQLHSSFKEIVDALVEQKYRMAVAGVADALNEVQTLTARLREEKELIQNVTEELTT